MGIDAVWKALPKRIREGGLGRDTLEGLHLQEIRMRCGQPILLKGKEGSLFLRQDGKLAKTAERSIHVSKADIQETTSLLSAYSLYAFEEELRQGYLTIEGGHRVGFCGKAVMEHGEIRTLRQINALNIRIAREIKGCAAKVLPLLLENGDFCHSLIVSPPGCGKTTLLRDIVRCLSSGEGCRPMTVGIVDERGEIAPLWDGMPQMDLGPCTDILEGCPKAGGMLLLLRSMSPDVIATDELGRPEDIYAVEEALNAGVKLVSTVHGRDMDDLKSRPYLRELVGKRIFERFIFLSGSRGTGTVEKICSGEGERLWKGGSAAWSGSFV